MRASSEFTLSSQKPDYASLPKTRDSSSSAQQLVQRILDILRQKIEAISNKDVGASIASGSYASCHGGDSLLGGTLAKIAAGTCDDLIARSADVMLKEARRLVLCVRDTPFSRIHSKTCCVRTSWRGHHARDSLLLSPSENDRYLVVQYVCPRVGANGIAARRNVHWTGSAAAKEAKA